MKKCENCEENEVKLMDIIYDSISEDVIKTNECEKIMMKISLPELAEICLNWKHQNIKNEKV